jgi:hypothetical protein
MYFEEREEVVPENVVRSKPLAYYLASPIKWAPWQENLLKAAQYIREHGWCQHRMEDTDGRVCLVGAIKRTLGMSLDSLVFGIEFNKMDTFIGDKDLGGWNDNPSRTKEEVIAALEGAAKRGE